MLGPFLHRSVLISRFPAPAWSSRRRTDTVFQYAISLNCRRRLGIWAWALSNSSLSLFSSCRPLLPVSPCSGIFHYTFSPPRHQLQTASGACEACYPLNHHRPAAPIPVFSSLAPRLSQLYQVYREHTVYQEILSGIISWQSPATPLTTHPALVWTTQLPFQSLESLLAPHRSPALPTLGFSPPKRALSGTSTCISLWRSTPRTAHPRAYSSESRPSRKPLIAMKDPVHRSVSPYPDPKVKGPRSKIQEKGPSTLFKSESCPLRPRPSVLRDASLTPTPTSTSPSLSLSYKKTFSPPCSTRPLSSPISITLTTKY